MELSVVVASFADPEGLYLTVFSLIQQLLPSGLDWEIVIAADGGTPVKWEKLPHVSCLRLTGSLRTGSPQGTRDAGIRAAKYETVLCVESHCIVSDVEQWMHVHRLLKDAAMSFPARIGESTELFSVYGTTTNWDGDLWIKRHTYEPYAQPKRTVQFGHAAFMLDRNWYIYNGGYCLAQQGWGGEEPFLCLKAWMLGKSCWVVPSIWFAHYLKEGAHTNYRTTDSFIRNMAIVKYVMTGEAGGLYLTPELTTERQRMVNGPYGGDLSKLKEFFVNEGIIP